MLGNGSDDLNKYMAACKRVSWRSERKFEYLECHYVSGMGCLLGRC